MFRKHWILAIASAAVIMMTAVSAHAGTFGTVVAIGGEAADLALDPTRGVLYIANFTANRIDVMSLSSNTIKTSINVPNQPSSISVSPDSHWLLVASYGNNATGSSTNALTLIDLTNANSKQTFTLSNAPLSVAFGLDNKALVVTIGRIYHFRSDGGYHDADPHHRAGSHAGHSSTAADVPGQLHPGVRRGLGRWTDDRRIGRRHQQRDSGVSLQRRAPTAFRQLHISPRRPPVRASSVSSQDGTLSTFDWTVQDANLNVTAQFRNPSGFLSLGSTLIDSSRGLIYAQIPITGTAATAHTASHRFCTIVDSDNLTLEDQIQLPENLAGKSLLSADNNTMYAISDSGIMILPVGNLKSYPRLSASVEDVVFRGNFCNRNIATQTLTITDPGGGHTPFSISTTTPGISVSPSSGVTPATVSVSVDPNAFASAQGHRDRVPEHQL